MDRFEERFFRQVSTTVDTLLACPDDERLDATRHAVQQTLLTVHPDGSWPHPTLLAEAMQAYLDVLAAGPGESDLDPADRRWLDACRSSIASPQLLTDLLDDLRADIEPPAPRLGDSGAPTESF